MVLQDPEGTIRVELLLPKGDDGDAVVPSGPQHVEETADPGPIRRGPEAISRARGEVVEEDERGQVSDQGRMGQQRALGWSGAAGRVHDPRGIVGTRLDRRELLAAALLERRR